MLELFEADLRSTSYSRADFRLVVTWNHFTFHTRKIYHVTSYELLTTLKTIVAVVYLIKCMLIDNHQTEGFNICSIKFKEI